MGTRTETRGGWNGQRRMLITCGESQKQLLTGAPTVGRTDHRPILALDCRADGQAGAAVWARIWGCPGPGRLSPRQTDWVRRDCPTPVWGCVAQQQGRACRTRRRRRGAGRAGVSPPGVSPVRCLHRRRANLAAGGEAGIFFFRITMASSTQPSPAQHDSNADAMRCEVGGRVGRFGSGWWPRRWDGPPHLVDLVGVRSAGPPPTTATAPSHHITECITLHYITLRRETPTLAARVQPASR